MHIIILFENSFQQQIHSNGNIFGNKCCRCNEGSLYNIEDGQEEPRSQNIAYQWHQHKRQTNKTGNAQATKKSKLTGSLFTERVSTVLDRIQQTPSLNPND